MRKNTLDKYCILKTCRVRDIILTGRRHTKSISGIEFSLRHRTALAKYLLKIVGWLWFRSLFVGIPFVLFGKMSLIIFQKFLRLVTFSSTNSFWNALSTYLSLLLYVFLNFLYKFQCFFFGSTSFSQHAITAYHTFPYVRIQPEARLSFHFLNNLRGMVVEDSFHSFVKIR